MGGADRTHQDSRGGQHRNVSVIVSQVSPLKAELSPYAALSADARAEVQRQIDTLAGTFVRDVAKAHGVSAATLKSDFGKGRILNARDAVAAKMIDGIGTFTDAFQD